jgi:hypothetical protein
MILIHYIQYVMVRNNLIYVMLVGSLLFAVKGFGVLGIICMNVCCCNCCHDNVVKGFWALCMCLFGHSLVGDHLLLRDFGPLGCYL